MNQAVFISDLHLHPEHDEIFSRFKRWVNWALKNTASVYILGDFFHVWAGDDSIDQWSGEVLKQLKRFAKHDIPVYFMVGNRDFLLGKKAAQSANFHILTEPYVLTLGQQRILLAHGDGFCTDDRAHQRFRRLTRHPIFIKLFLTLPLAVRKNIVCCIRAQSQKKQRMQAPIMTNEKAIIHAVKNFQVDAVIHGHTHRPQAVYCATTDHPFMHYILSDWDENPSILCYNLDKGFFFERFEGGNDA